MSASFTAPLPRGLVLTAPCTKSTHLDYGHETGLATEYDGPAPGPSRVFLVLSMVGGGHFTPS